MPALVVPLAQGCPVRRVGLNRHGCIEKEEQEVSKRVLAYF
jgi:hypothetical protein